MHSRFNLYWLIIILVVSQLEVKAANYSYLIGGGGESTPTSSFDDEIKNYEYINQFTKNQKIFFNGGHPVLKDRLNSLFPNVNKSRFLREDYEKFLKELVNDLKSGKIKEGDQILINIFSHGSEIEEGTASHKIALKTLNQEKSIDLSNLDGADSISLDSLQEIISLSEKNGIKLGIIDQSCFGGATANLAKKMKNVCVLSGSSKMSPNLGVEVPDANVELMNSYGMTKSAFRAFSEAFKKGNTNLEEVYLYALEHTKAGVTPTSSILKFDKIEDVLIDSLTGIINPLTTAEYTQKSNYIGDISSCEIDLEINKIVKEISDTLKNINSSSKEYFNIVKQKDDYLRTKNELSSFVSVTNQVSQEIIKLNATLYEYKIPIEDGRESISYLKREEIILNPELAILNMKGDAKSITDLNKRKKFEEIHTANIWDLNKKYLKIISDKFPNYKIGDDSRKEELNNKFFTSSVSFMNGLNMLKKEIYELSVNKEESNPCRDFKIQ